MDEQITVHATVKGKEELEDGWKLTLVIPAFKSKYDAVVYGLNDPIEASHIKAGGEYYVVLNKNKLAKSDYSGDLYWHWSWRWGGIGQGADAKIPQASQDGSGAPSGDSGGYTDAKNTSIERQVALKAAVEFATVRIKEGEKLHSVAVVNVAALFSKFLTTGKGIVPKAKEPTQRHPPPTQAELDEMDSSGPQAKAPSQRQAMTQQAEIEAALEDPEKALFGDGSQEVEPGDPGF